MDKQCPPWMDLLCRAHGIPVPVPEYRFAPPRRWRFDWAWEAQHVALEIEGGLFGRGKPCPVCKRRSPAGHSSVERLLADLEKYNAAVVAGWRLVRCTPGQLRSGEGLAVVKKIMEVQE